MITFKSVLLLNSSSFSRLIKNGEKASLPSEELEKYGRKISKENPPNNFLIKEALKKFNKGQHPNATCWQVTDIFMLNRYFIYQSLKKLSA